MSFADCRSAGHAAAVALHDVDFIIAIAIGLKDEGTWDNAQHDLSVCWLACSYKSIRATRRRSGAAWKSLMGRITEPCAADRPL